jgi:hypothetical protein
MGAYLTFLNIVLLFILPIPLYAQNWQPFLPSDKPSTQTFQYDLESKKKVSDTITRVWVKAEAKEQTGKKGASPVARAYYLIEANCQERTYRVLSTAEYAADGRLLSSSNEGDRPWYHIVPESMAFYLHKAICQK